LLERLEQLFLGLTHINRAKTEMKSFMTAKQTLRHIILAAFLLFLEKRDKLNSLVSDADFLDQMHRIDSINASNIDPIYEYFEDRYSSYIDEVITEISEGSVHTDISCEFDRNYETESVAMMSPYGKWVGWTLYTGGGKHGQPEQYTYESMKDDCYLLDASYETKLVQVITLTLPDVIKKEETNDK
jgi:hypothetical protein